MKTVVIYTDGACSGNPGIGGWGATISYGDHRKDIFGGEKESTNNRMELTAAIRALQTLKTPCVAEIHTDSNYLKNGITTWIKNWKANGWRTASKQPVKNIDLWQELDKEIASHTIHWRWVKGHSGNEGNERADALANQGVTKIRSELR
jgi:ribonuclease HI